MGSAAAEFVMVYITAPDRAEAIRIGRALVEGNLAACVNILGEAVSVYRWQGQIEEASEVVLIAKARAQSFDQLAAKVKALHSYDTPCIVAYPMIDGAAPYLAWLRESTADS